MQRGPEGGLDGEQATKILLSMAHEFAKMDRRFASTIFSYFTVDERLAGIINHHHDALMVDGSGLHAYGIAMTRLEEGKFPEMDAVMYGGSGPPRSASCNDIGGCRPACTW